LRENGGVVALEGAGLIISCPMQVHNIAKVLPAKRAPVSEA